MPRGTEDEPFGQADPELAELLARRRKRRRGFDWPRLVKTVGVMAAITAALFVLSELPGVYRRVQLKREGREWLSRPVQPHEVGRFHEFRREYRKEFGKEFDG